MGYRLFGAASRTFSGSRFVMATEKSTGSRAEKSADRAFWTVPGGSATVTYSLPVFHEIEFAVSEGFRKIPHGGVEIGGLLFGSVNDSGTNIEAVRGIFCDHASRPAFLLSRNDLERLARQLPAARR